MFQGASCRQYDLFIDKNTEDALRRSVNCPSCTVGLFKQNDCPQCWGDLKAKAQDCLVWIPVDRYPNIDDEINIIADTDGIKAVIGEARIIDKDVRGSIYAAQIHYRLFHKPRLWNETVQVVREMV